MPPRERTSSVTLSAVARRARVSTATVSYVLNGVRESRIPEATRTRVREAAHDLGYVPNVSARSLRTGRSNLVISHMPGRQVMLPRAAAGLDRLGSRLRDHGYTLMVHNDPTLNGMAAARVWSALRPTAVITEHALMTPDAMELLHSVGTVVVLISHKAVGSVPTLVFDDSVLGEVAGRNLLERGCRDLVMVLPKEERARFLGLGRLAGLKRAASSYMGVRIRTVDMAPDAGDAARIAASWAERERPDGVMGFDDLFAGLLLAALLDHGLTPPKALGLIGANNDDLCEMMRPRLSSSALDLDVLEQCIADPVLAAIRGTWTPAEIGSPWTATLFLRDT